MPAPHFSTSQDGVQSNPRSKGGICGTALHPCSLLPPTRRWAPHGCTPSCPLPTAAPGQTNVHPLGDA